MQTVVMIRRGKEDKIITVPMAQITWIFHFDDLGSVCVVSGQKATALDTNSVRGRNT